MIGSFDRGDTIVEVLFAVTIFSLVSVLGISLMNQSTATAQRALEINLVRQEIDAQAEILRFLNNSYIAAYRAGATATSYPAGTPARLWYDLTHNPGYATDLGDNKISYTDETSCPTKLNIPARSFVFNTRKVQTIMSSAIYSSADTYARVEYNDAGVALNSYGLWILQVKPAADVDPNRSKYVDFYIRACWENPGQTIPLKDGTLVRLYAPD